MTELTKRRFTPLAALALAGVLLGGCGEARVQSEDDLCTQYAQLDDRVDALTDLDPDTVTGDELATRAEAVQEQLDAFQATAEGRLDTAVSTLRSAVNDLAVSAAAVTQEALDTVRPLIEDALDDVDEAWARVESLADPNCKET